MEDEVKYETEQPEVIRFDWLDLGAGRWRKKDHVAIDNGEAEGFQGATKEDTKWTIYFDLNKGIPYPDNSIDDIYASHILEHMNDPISLLREIWRVSHANAHATIIVPLHEMISVGHVTEFTESWFEQNLLESFPGMFSIVRKEIKRNKPADLRQPDGSTVPRFFDELTIVLKIVK